MAASATRRIAEPPRVVAVATSGGRDSTALLHATVHAAGALGARVVALHVHHGLMPQADAWLAHVRAQCRRWSAAGHPVSFVARRLAGPPAAGDSVEAWARRERYAALAAMAASAGATLVLLAHHRSDQAETFLLQALRGAGPAGLAAMPRAVRRAGLTWARPWLDIDGAQIAAYVARHRLRHIDDPSNADAAFARSRLRARVMPVLRDAFADAEVALVAAARQAQWARECLDEVGRDDLAPLVDDAGALDLRGLHALGRARARNALRVWLHDRLGRSPPATLLDRLDTELAKAPAGSRWPLPGAASLLLHRARLQVRDDAASPSLRSRPSCVLLSIAAPGLVDVPAWGGRLQVRAVHRDGVALARLHRCELRVRSGGERFQFTPRSTARSLKKQFQAADVPASARDAPLLWCDGELVFVPGLGIDARARAVPGEPQAVLQWLPDVAASGSRRRAR